MMAEFENLELDPKQTFCFGFCPLRRAKDGRPRGWYDIARASDTFGWGKTDVEALDKDLAADVDASYGYLCQTVMNDLDSGIRYRLAFENDSALWVMGILDSPLAEILPEQATAFFKSEYVRKFAARCGFYLKRAALCYENTLAPRVSDGELMSFSPVKMERILFLCGNGHAMDNLVGCKFKLQ